MNPTVLIVDDDFDSRSSLADVLSAEGYDIREAVDGLDALQTLGACTRPCLILLDLRMPRMDGFEFLARLRKLDGIGNVPVIVFTAGTESKVPGADWVVQKPADLDDLLSHLRTHCGLPVSATA